MRSDMDHTVLTANYTMPAFTPQLQSIVALWLVLILPSHEGEYITYCIVVRVYSVGPIGL